MQLYVGPESVDGYQRDGCVFKEDIDIYDSMTAVVSYSNGVVMNYSLNAFMPYEGYSLLFVCEKGTLAVRLKERLPGGDETEIVVTRSFSKEAERRASARCEGHGGGDQRLRDIIFRGAEGAKTLELPGFRRWRLFLPRLRRSQPGIDEKAP